jgi:cysteine-rich repeat protein
MRLYLLVLTALAGCLEPNIDSCGNGLDCPGELACDVAHHTCTPPDQLAACANVPEGGPCSTELTPNGACDQGTCMAIACGNGRVEPGEVCDDGNTASGDGCRGDCLSDENCANGILDAGETCDDGNLLSHDGCDSRCQTEMLTWSPIVPVAAPQSVVAATYDTDRQQLVAVVSIGIQIVTTEVWDGHAWRDVRPTSQPPMRAQPAMTYDPRAHRVVMFGGINQSENNETWLWDGTRWTLAQPAASPPPRSGATMVFDQSRGRVVLFGGTAGFRALADAWEWDGTSWWQIPATTSGPRGSMFAAAFDEISTQIVVFGGIDVDGVPLTDTWSWDGRVWQQQPPANNPPPMAGGAMSYSPASRTVVLSGGDHTWRWDGAKATWSEDADPLATAQRGAHVSFFDPVSAATTIVGGKLPFARYVDPVVGWTPIADPTRPSQRPLASLVYDPSTQEIVMTGGLTDSSVDSATTWLLAGESWQGVVPGMKPPSNPLQQAATFDEEAGVVTVYGDQADNSVYTWDGRSRTWTQHAPIAATWPHVRTMTAMAYDGARGRTVMFGGSGSTIGSLGDTWEWDGSEWTALPAGANNPPVRSGHRMVYDPIRKTIVMFGGYETLDAVDYTVWEWDRGWTPITPAFSGAAPPARTTFGMAFDPALGETLVFGGSDANNAPLSDAWSWNGSRWRKLDVRGISTRWSNHAISMTYDPALAGFIVYGDWQDQPVGLLRWTSATGVEEVCRSAIDADGDGLAGCFDADCKLACAGAP